MIFDKVFGFLNAPINTPSRLIASMLVSFCAGIAILVNCPTDRVFSIGVAVVAVILVAYSALVLVFLCAGFLVLVYKGVRYGSETGPEVEADDSFEGAPSSGMGIGYYDPACFASTDLTKQAMAAIFQSEDHLL